METSLFCASDGVAFFSGTEQLVKPQRNSRMLIRMDGVIYTCLGRVVCLKRLTGAMLLQIYENIVFPELEPHCLDGNLATYRN